MSTRKYNEISLGTTKSSATQPDAESSVQLGC